MGLCTVTGSKQTKAKRPGMTLTGSKVPRMESTGWSAAGTRRRLRCCAVTAARRGVCRWGGRRQPTNVDTSETFDEQTSQAAGGPQAWTRLFRRSLTRTCSVKNKATTDTSVYSHVAIPLVFDFTASLQGKVILDSGATCSVGAVDQRAYVQHQFWQHGISFNAGQNR